MKKIIKIIVCSLICLSINILTLNVKSSYAEEISTYAIERYNRTITFGLNDMGSVKITLVLNHNLTTKKTFIEEVQKEINFNKAYIFLKFKSVKTNPDIGVTFTGSKQIKVTITYANEIPGNSQTYTRSDYITL